MSKQIAFILIFVLVSLSCCAYYALRHPYIPSNHFSGLCQQAASTVDKAGKKISLPMIVISPDGQWTAHIYEDVCGLFSPSEPVTYLTLTRRRHSEDRDENDSPMLLTDDDAVIPKLNWFDAKTLEIKLPHHVHSDKLRNTYKDIQLKYVAE